MSTTDSLANLYIDINFISNGATIRLPSQDLFQSAEFESSDEGAWVGHVVLFDPEGDFLESLIIGAGNSRALSVEYGYENDPSSRRMIQGEISTYETEILPEGVTLKIDILPTGIMAAAIDKVSRGWPAGSRISDIVEELARERGWALSDEQGRATIEATLDELPEPVSTAQESDFAFIKNTLQPMARNEAGEGGYVCYVDTTSNAFHFHTPAFGVRSKAFYEYARSARGQVISFTPTENVFQSILNGGGSSVFSSIDSEAGQGTQLEGDVGSLDGAPLSNPENNQAVADIVPDGGIGARIPIIARHEAEIEMVASSVHARMARESYKAEMEVIGTHNVLPSDYVEVEYRTKQGSRHYLSGDFQILKVMQTIDGGGWRTKFEMYRTGVTTVQGAADVPSSRNPPTRPAGTQQQSQQVRRGSSGRAERRRANRG